MQASKEYGAQKRVQLLLSITKVKQTFIIIQYLLYIHKTIAIYTLINYSSPARLCLNWSISVKSITCWGKEFQILIVDIGDSKGGPGGPRPPLLKNNF